jgi:polygalacturonase
MNITNRGRIAGISIALAVSLLTSFADQLPSIPRVAAPRIPKRTVSLADFATGDGIALNTAAFEKAIASLASKGGGRLVVPPGIWLTGPIRLQSKIELHLERGALIQFSRDFNLYPLTVFDVKGEKSVESMSPIFGQDLEDVAITGEGIIDGGGDAWRPLKKDKVSDADWKAFVRSGGVVSDKGDTWYPSRDVMEGFKKVEALRKAHSLNLADYEPSHQFLRPRMVRILGCTRVLLQDTTFRNPPNWTLNPALCEDVLIQNVQVRNLLSAQNSDALDLESCRRAIIRDSTFDAGDDGICIKSGKDAEGRRIGVPCEDVLVEGCTVYHAHGGFTIGSEMSGGVRNFRVNNCTFLGTDIGLRFKSTRGRGGVVEKIYISNIRMADLTSNAIDFDLYYEKKSSETNSFAVDEGTPQFRDIHIDNIICRGAEGAIVLQGLPEMALHDITLNNVSITSKRGVSVTDADEIRFNNVRVDNQTGPRLSQVRVMNSKLDLVQ